MKKRMVFGMSALALVALASMFYVKTDVREMHRERLALLEKQRQLQENIRVLQAEFAFLTNPQRLQVQAQAMGLVPQKNTQVLPLVMTAGVTAHEPR